MGKDRPDYVNTVGNMAMVYEQNGELDRALEMYEDTRVVCEVSWAHGTGLQAPVGAWRMQGTASPA